MWSVKTYALVGVVALSLVGGVFMFSSLAPAQSMSKTNARDDALVLDIETRGASRAYADLAHAIRDLPPSMQHARAHAFGAALYSAEGIDGLSVCDTQFSYGCFHEFIGSAIAEHGVSAARLLNERCIDALGYTDAGFCQHGVGHGLQTYYGYERHNLDEALALCASLPDNNTIGGCAGGIFMEYNMRTMLDTESGERRPVADALFEPCASLTGDGQEACAYWQPQWWHEVQFSGDDSLETFRALGTQCREFGFSDRLTQQCMTGIGNIIPNMRHLTLEDAAARCDSATAGDASWYRSCVATARERVQANMQAQ